MSDQQITKKDFENLRNDLHEAREIFEKSITDNVLSRLDRIEQAQITLYKELPKRVADETHQQVIAQVEPKIEAVEEKINGHIKPENPLPHPKQKQSIPAWQIVMICLTIAVTGSLVGSQLIPIKNEIAEVKSALNIHVNETK